MRINYSSFKGQLEKGLAPIYFIFGDATLLVEESLDRLRQVARAAEFTERIRFTADQGFDWHQIFASGQSMSLFAEKRLVELRIPSGKPGDGGGKALVEYAATPPADDTILAVISSGIEWRGQKTKWFQTLQSAAVTVECPQIEINKLPDWIATRMRQQGLQFEREVAERLAYCVEGNLLAAAQEINLLSLLSKDGQVSLELVENLIADHARFSAFAFVDACLAGLAHRATRILQSLKQAQSQPILILWVLTRDVRAVCNLAAIRAQGGNPGAQLKRFGIWGARAGIVNATLRRLSLAQCQKLLGKLAHAELQLKGRAPMQRADIWEEIESIGLGLSGVNIP